MRDVLDIDPDVLDSTAGSVEAYCGRQIAIMDNYLAHIYSLSSEWSDDETFGSLLEEVRGLKNNVAALMEEIKVTYPPFFRERADFIRHRPKKR